MDLSELKNLADFSSLVIRLASSEQIRSWSRGEVTKPETINYRTLKPEKDGLFDERIFGPTKDWECYCGKYKRIRYRGIICDKCGVEVTQSRVRRERMGHISLATPIAHVWFFKGAPSKLSLLLDVAPRAIEQVIYFARYIVVSVEEEKIKTALSAVQKAFKEKEKEINQDFDDREDNARQKTKRELDSARKKITNKEQFALAKEELELEERKILVNLGEERRVSIEKTKELFDKLQTLIRSIKPGSLLSEEEYDELGSYGASGFLLAKMGAEGILEMIANINLEELSAQLREQLESTKGARYVKIAKRLKLIDGMRRSTISPSSMILKVLPVLPPDLRPMVQLSGGRFATSDLNDLYRRVINRNNRLRHLIELGAPEIILRNEKRMLQEAVDSLIDASQRQATRRGRGRQPLRSLSDMLRGKQGRFRQNLLGKRVDYSGRSVIVVGPDLKLNQCGLPKEMALEMFKPFVLREMIVRGIAPNVKSAKNMLERRPPEVFDILEEITRDHPVLLNRAPTLHKLSIQAFYPVLIEGSAIRIHPVVCSGFNADFDGDQMAVHVPLSGKAKKEASELMIPENNLLKPADGTAVAIPSTKEMALGIFYLTTEDPEAAEYKTIFCSKDEAILAWQTEYIGLRQKINVRLDETVVSTTIGRILFNEVLDDYFSYVNEPVTSAVIKRIFNQAFANVERSKVIEMVDAIKDLGFWAGTVSGISFAVFDGHIYPGKDKMLSQANQRAAEIDENYRNGLITDKERRRLTQEVWIETTEELANRTWEMFSKTNPIKMIIDAGVGRASRDQVKQIAAIRGLVVDPLGKIVELPIRSNFREGLSIYEYVTSARGGRKGLTDTAIKTADAGYLTRRLVDVAHETIVRLEDCGGKDGLTIKQEERPKSFLSRIIGRCLAAEVIDPKTKEVIFPTGSIVGEAELAGIDEAKIGEVKVRSPLTCSSRYGICSTCYGWDLGTKKQVEVGVPVGVIAAQSIGEPGTQLTLKTKHAAGIVGVDVTQGLPRVDELFEARTPKSLSPIAEISGKVQIVQEEDAWRVKILATVKPKEEREYIISRTATLLVEDKQLVAAGTQLATGSLDIKEVLGIRGLRAAQEYLIRELQAVYESQGIPINDRHFEVIVRKISDKVRIISSGDTPLLPRELVDKTRFEEENEKVLAAGGEPATAHQIILGITRASISTESWLSAASFEQTTNVLTDAALEGKEDKLLGLKENVIIGRLIPVTTERARLHQTPQEVL